MQSVLWLQKSSLEQDWSAWLGPSHRHTPWWTEGSSPNTTGCIGKGRISFEPKGWSPRWFAWTRENRGTACWVLDKPLIFYLHNRLRMVTERYIGCYSVWCRCLWHMYLNATVGVTWTVWPVQQQLEAVRRFAQSRTCTSFVFWAMYSKIMPRCPWDLQCCSQKNSMQLEPLVTAVTQVVLRFPHFALARYECRSSCAKMLPLP